MLIRQSILELIAAGKVECAFRRWARPTVKTGGTLMTSIGVLRVDEVAKVPLASITARDARKAGYDTKGALLADLAARDRGSIYRIDLHFEGADPRMALRQKSDLSAGEIAELRSKLARFDAASPHGPWTLRAMEAIRRRPREKAADLAAGLGVPKEWLKISIRKLKNLGLTISHEPGYELSPRGLRLLEDLAGP